MDVALRRRGIHHLGLTVSDVERSARSYEEVLGFERSARGSAADERQNDFLRHRHRLRRLDDHGVTHSAVATSFAMPGAEADVFRDPDYM